MIFEIGSNGTATTLVIVVKTLFDNNIWTKLVNCAQPFYLSTDHEKI